MKAQKAASAPKAHAPTSATGSAPAAFQGFSGRGGILLAAAIIVLAVWAAYANSLSTPFVFDDLKSITQNPTIRDLGRMGDVLSPPSGLTGVAGRPMVNLSLAINYGLGGLQVRGYHVMNLLIHLLAALTLFGVVRRTLLLPSIREKFAAMALPLAGVIALLWALHPLQTESVTCVIQRTESLVGLFYLLTFYCFIRAIDAPSNRWSILAVVACLLGMATKEVMVSAPVLLLLYDRAFAAGDFGTAWRQRRNLYLGLAATWLLLAGLMLSSHQRSGSVGFGLGVSSWEYALTQCRAIILYLRLAVWPSPLVVDYGTGVARSVAEVWPQGLLLLALVAGTFVALRRWPRLGFLAFAFFAILAPSSSVVPLVSQTIAEHRMYLPLAVVAILFVVGGYRWLGRAIVPVGLMLAAIAGWRTAARNADFHDALTLWGVTVDHAPDNGRAQMNFATALAAAGRLDEAREHYAEATRLTPNFAEAHYSLAGTLLQLNRVQEAQAEAEKAVSLKPNLAEAHYVLGTALLKQSQVDAAVEQFQLALQLRHNFPDAEHTLAGTYAMTGRTAEALEHYAAALRLQPDNPRLHDEIGGVLAQHDRLEEAVGHFETAVRLAPDALGAHFNLGTALFSLQRFPEAAEQYAIVVRLRPDFAEAHNNLGNALAQIGRLDEAQAQYEEALRLKPDYAPARNNLQRLQNRRTDPATR